MMVGVQGVLEAEKGDQLVGYNAEDFKRLEKEDESYRERKQRRNSSPERQVSERWTWF